MSNYNDTLILNLIDQIRNVNHLIDLHRLAGDDFMLGQYKARKKDFLKELVFELMNLDVNTDEIFQLVRDLISQIERETPKTDKQDSIQNLHFSIKELISLAS